MADVAEPGEPLINLKAVGKAYSGVWVLKDASFSCQARRNCRPRRRKRRRQIDAQEHHLRLGCARCRCNRHSRKVLFALDARRTHARLGIAAIHQELSLFPNLSIAENVHMGIGTLPTRAGLVDRAAMAQETLAPAERLLPVAGRSSHRPWSDSRLGSGNWWRSPRRCAAPRPCSSSTNRRLRSAFRSGVACSMLRGGLRERGYALIYITHFMEEVYELADRIVVLARRAGGRHRHAERNSPAPADQSHGRPRAGEDRCRSRLRSQTRRPPAPSAAGNSEPSRRFRFAGFCAA